jgi:hypothetical protein
VRLHDLQAAPGTAGSSCGVACSIPIAAGDNRGGPEQPDGWMRLSFLGSRPVVVISVVLVIFIGQGSAHFA